MKKNKLLRRLTAALLAAVLTLSIALPGHNETDRM